MLCYNKGEDMKLCSKCLKAKKLEEFNNNRGSKDGKESQCRKCAKQRWAHRGTVEYREMAKEKYKNRTPEEVARRKEYFKTWSQNNKEKLACRRKEYIKKMPAGVYGLYNKETQKMYIGQSKYMTKRKWRHFEKLKKGNHSNKLMQEDFNNFGIDSFEFIVLAEVKKSKEGITPEEREHLLLLEAEVIVNYVLECGHKDGLYNKIVPAGRILLSDDSNAQ